MPNEYNPLQTTWSDTWQTLKDPEYWSSLWKGNPNFASPRQKDVMKNMGEGEKKYWANQVLDENGVNDSNVNSELPQMLIQGYERQKQGEQRAANKQEMLETAGNFISPSIVDMLKNPISNGPRDFRPFQAAIELGAGALGGSQVNALKAALMKGASKGEAALQFAGRMGLSHDLPYLSQGYQYSSGGSRMKPPAYDPTNSPYKYVDPEAVKNYVSQKGSD